MPAAVGVAPDPPGRELTRERPACADTASESWPISQGGCIPDANCGLYRDLGWGGTVPERGERCGPVSRSRAGECGSGSSRR